MTKRVLFLLSMMALAWMGVFALDVRDFGAKGDGIADDTDAIQRAILKAEEAEFNVLAGYSAELEWSGHGGHGSGGEVYLPKGTYRLTRPLVTTRRRAIFRGEDGTTLVGAPGQDTIYFHHVGRAVIENIVFQGGRIQLNYYTHNNDMTMLRMEGCSFLNPELESIRAYNAKAEEWRGIPTYLVSNNEQGLPILTPNPEYENSPGLLPNSTIFAAVDCRFQGSATFISGGSDQFVVENCTFDRVGGTLPIFHCTGQTNFRNVQATYSAPVPGGPDCWMFRGPYDHRVEAEMGCDTTSLVDCRLLCKDGAKLSLLRSDKKASYYNSTLRLHGCQLDLGGAPVVRIAPDTSIGIIDLQNNKNLDDRVVPLVVYEKVPTWEDLKTKIRYKWFDFTSVNTQYKILVRDNQGFDEGFPEVFRPFFCTPHSKEDIARAKVDTRPADAWPADADFHGRVIRPAFAAGISDAQALQAAFDQAQPGDRVVLPGRRLGIDAALTIKGGVEVLAEGIALFDATEHKGLPSLLTIQGEGDTLLRNIAFGGGAHAVEIPYGGFRHVFKNCLFLAQSQTAILGMNFPDSILIIDGLFFSHGGLQTNANHTEFRRNWLCNDPLMDEEAFVVQNGGEMLVEYNLFVPILPKVSIETFKPVPKFADIKAQTNLRWFDNHNGRLMFQYSRLGGEFGGMTPAHLFGNDATLFHHGAYCWFGNFYGKRCMAYLNDTPALVLFQSVLFNGESFIGDEYPYNVTIRNPQTGEDVPKAVIPEAKSAGVTFYSK